MVSDPLRQVHIKVDDRIQVSISSRTKNETPTHWTIQSVPPTRELFVFRMATAAEAEGMATAAHLSEGDKVGGGARFTLVFLVF